MFHDWNCWGIPDIDNTPLDNTNFSKIVVELKIPVFPNLIRMEQPVMEKYIFQYSFSGVVPPSCNTMNYTGKEIIVSVDGSLAAQKMFWKNIHKELYETAKSVASVKIDSIKIYNVKELTNED